MKQLKRCDGYVLPYVLVVFLILSAAAMAICAVSLNNFKAQEAAVKRSQALYEAEGEIEKCMVRMRSYKKTVVGDMDDVWEDYKANAAMESIQITLADFAEVDAVQTCTATLQINQNSVQLTGKVHVALTVTLIPESEGENREQISEQAIVVEKAEVEYDSYTISYEGGGAG